MTWRKHFRMVKMPGVQQPQQPRGVAGGSGGKYSSYLPEVYAGHPNRIQRYFQYEDMDRDSEINAALDTIADFCTQSEEQNDQPFFIHYNEEANQTEVKLIHTYLQKWTKMNTFRSRLYMTFRNVIKNGDAFFLRDPETKEWLWISHYDVELVRVDEASGKEPLEYVIRNLDYGKQDKFATKPADPNDYNTPTGMATSPFSRTSSTSGGGGNMFTLPGQGSDPRFGNNTVPESHVVDAKHVVHLSLSTGMDSNWPFGASVLEPVFKTFKQKELLEDAVIIYRVQRAPERRIFYIDVGNMPPVMANAHVERIKNDIHQRRIPNRTGGGNSIMDAAYNPLTMMEDYFFAQSAEGRGSKVETLAGGEQLGEISDLEFFNKKLRAGLRIPSSYLPGGDDNNGQVAYNDGKMGSAMIQEFRFNKYCMRLQSLLAPVFDKEFKMFLKDNGIQIEESLFELFFNPPQNFTKYRQIELDAAQMSVYTQISDNKKLAERFKFKRFLNLTEEELLENERMWAEENPAKMQGAVGKTAADNSPGDGLGSVGVSSGGGGFGDFGDDDLGGDDLGDGGDIDAGGDSGDADGDMGSEPPIGGDTSGTE